MAGALIEFFCFIFKFIPRFRELGDKLETLVENVSSVLTAIYVVINKKFHDPQAEQEVSRILGKFIANTNTSDLPEVLLNQLDRTVRDYNEILDKRHRDFIDPVRALTKRLDDCTSAVEVWKFSIQLGMASDDRYMNAVLGELIAGLETKPDLSDNERKEHITKAKHKIILLKYPLFLQVLGFLYGAGTTILAGLFLTLSKAEKALVEDYFYTASDSVKWLTAAVKDIFFTILPVSQLGACREWYNLLTVFSLLAAISICIKKSCRATEGKRIFQILFAVGLPWISFWTTCAIIPFAPLWMEVLCIPLCNGVTCAFVWWLGQKPADGNTP